MIYFNAIYFLGVLGLFFDTNNDKNKVFLYYVLLILLIFSALRVNVGFDYWNYVDLINGVQDSDRIERFSKLFIDISNYLEEPQIFFILNSFIFVFFMSWGLKKFNSLDGVSLFVFLTFPLLFLRSLDIVRQYTAMAIVFFASSLLVGDISWRKRVKYIIYSFIGVGFHFPAILLVFINFFFSFEKLRKFFFGILNFYNFLIFSAIAYLMSSYVINYISSLGFEGYYFSYFENLSDNAGLKIFLFYELLIAALIFVMKKLKIESEQQKFSCVMLFSGGVIYAFLSPYGEHLGRIFAYFLPYFIVCFSCVFNKLSAFNRASLKALLVIIGTASYYYMIYLRVIDESGDKLTNVKIFGF
ncbi:EpsG family protein [Comamonas testosteroni]|nr:EpsG family protein [Comamonas testosteroni]